MTDPNVSIRNSLYAAVGAGDAVVQAVADVVAQVRERAETNRADVNERVDTAREKLLALPGDLTETVESLRERLAGSATVVAGPAPGAAVQIVVGSELPPTQVTDAQASFVVTAPIDGVHLTGWEAPPVAPLDAKVLLRVSVERDG